MKASVCIATKDKPEHLKRVLDSIFSQSPGFEFEVIVVMDGSEKATRSVFTAYGNYPHLKTEWIPNSEYRNPCFARNLASRMACGDILIHQSDDVVHGDANVIERLVQMVTPRNFVIATVWNVDPTSMVWMDQYTGQKNQRGLFFLGAVTRANFYACGGNCEEFTEPGWEDNWLENSLTRGLGLERVFADDVLGFHLHHERRPLDHFKSRMRALFVEKERFAEAAKDPSAWMQLPWPYREGKALLG